MKFRDAIAAAFLVLVSASFGQAPAEKLLAQGRADEALRLLAQPRNAHEFNLQCRVFYQLEQWEPAVAACQKAVQAEPNNSRYQLWLGRAYGSRAAQVGGIKAFGLARKTVASFERAYQLQPSDEEARHDLAEYYLNAPGIVGGGRDKALRLAEQAPAPLAAWIRGFAAGGQGNQAETERQLKLAVQLSGNDGDKWVDLASYYLSRKRSSDFEMAAMQALGARKKSPSVLVDAAALLIRGQRNYDAAEKALRQYLAGATQESAPAFHAHCILGHLKQIEGNNAAAAEEYRRALALASTYRPAQEALRHLGGR